MPYADIDGTHLVVTDAGGDGPPVLFWHGEDRGARDGAYDHLVGGLGDVYRVLTARLRDDAPPPASVTDPWRLAGTLFGLLDAVGIERAVLCGASDAAAMVVRAALLHPDRVRGLALLHASLPAADAGQLPTAASAGGSGRVAGAPMAAEPADPDHLGERLDELAMPILLIHGDGDPERPVAHAHAVAAVVSDPRGVVEVAGGDAELTTTHAQLVTDAIRDYLENLPA